MHASSRDQDGRSGGTGTRVVAPGSRYLERFFRLFAEMPHRGSATPNESRAARLLTRRLEEDTAADVELQPFPVDTSSGAWGVAVHGLLLLFVTPGIWLAGLAAAWIAGLGPLPVQLGFLGRVPFPFAVTALTWCIALIASRFVEDKIGFHLGSFFVPNADSGNVIATSLPKLDPTGGNLRMPDRNRWKGRFEAAKADGQTKRIVVLMGHYDSARRLPPGETPGILVPAVKGGMGLLPTVMYVLLAAALATACVLGALGQDDIAHSGATGFIVALALTLAAVGALVVAAIEAGEAGHSAALPYVQGMNDNLSGAAAVYGALGSVLPLEGERTLSPDTHVIAAFTGSEENGLRGASRFSRDVLRPAIETFGVEQVQLINLDSVSGGRLLVRPKERTFTGRRIGGVPSFADTFHRWARQVHLSATDAGNVLTPQQIGSCLVAAPGGYGLELEYRPDPLPACTDLTGVWAGLPSGKRRKLRGFSIVSRQTRVDDPLMRPRDYHLESDNADALFLDEEPENFGTVAALVPFLAAWLRQPQP